MSSTLFEIVELADGCVGLRRSGEDGEPLISIRFSPEANDYLQEGRFEVVKAMIEAGLEAAGDMDAFESGDADYQLDSESRVIH